MEGLATFRHVYCVYEEIPMAMYEGGCHCQAVRFIVQLDDPKQELYRCNCSLCRKKSIVMRAVADTDLEVIAGQEHLSLYQ